MAIHHAGILDVLKLFSFLIEGFNGPGRRDETNAVRRLAVLADRPGLGIKVAFHLLGRTAIAADPGHRIIRYHPYFADLTVDRQRSAVGVAHGYLTHTHRCVRSHPDLNTHALRGAVQHLDHFDAFAQLRCAIQSTAGQRQFLLLAYLQIGRLHCHHSCRAVRHCAEIQTAFVVVPLEHAAGHLVVHYGKHLAEDGAIHLDIGAPLVTVVDYRLAGTDERCAIGVTPVTRTSKLSSPMYLAVMLPVSSPLPG